MQLSSDHGIAEAHMADAKAIAVNDKDLSLISVLLVLMTWLLHIGYAGTA